MTAIKWGAIAVAVYLVVVVAVETLIGVMGGRHASRGVAPDETWWVITTTDADGSARDTVVAGAEIDGRLYVAANHWPRAWYQRAVENPEIEVTRAGDTTEHRAVPVTGEEQARVAEAYELPWGIRFLTGFPPRAFLRLDPR